ncbi:MAG: CYTH domain-containing protein [Gammaproteobacteria bacterium]|nr:CYTH domain-containing protein [Gammaproteobacteria bacterium]NIM72142.1 CYTH domain-containing protein [Gammaproteobacteria bacterium]NIN38739.1 CYTH domain-containing protein [Gammaproteobacteria bacterium]NIO23884.1 CYTH domain-containing protein [Gammaproteobacteria bacterium]NIO64527.1 CYTH domain-containing protein [Gammaproteobacteria bacterium]
MATEIERKYLVRDDSWREHVHHQVRYEQGYLANTEHCSVRVRVGGDRAHLNIKSRTAGASRLELEYPVPVEDARTMLRELCRQPIIEKIRYRVRHQSQEWEVDVFEGDNAGLVVAEIELDDEAAPVSLPPWAGEEVTDDVRYYNSSLAVTPFNRW